MAQHGQVLKLRARRPDGKAVWAYRYRISGSRPKRPQVGEHIADAAGQEWDLITSVPSSGQREGQHPLERAIALAPPLAEQYRPMLARGEGALEHYRASDSGYVVTTSVAGASILLGDDTFTSGARIQSAASALRLAGATVVAAVPIGRVINPSFSPAAEELWQEARERQFDFGVCCLET